MRTETGAEIALQPVSRRGVIGAAGLTLLGTVIGTVAGPGTAGAAVGSTLRRDVFAPFVGRQLTVAGNGFSARVRLRAVDDVLGAPAGSDRAFALALQPLSGPLLPDGRYTIRGCGPAVTLFLSAVDRGRHRHYRVVVNQITYSATGVPQ